MHSFKSSVLLIVSSFTLVALITICMEINQTYYIGPVVHKQSVGSSVSQDGVPTYQQSFIGKCENSCTRLCLTDKRVIPCQPKQRIVFIKTHKTGSSSVTTLLQRYGYRRGLNFALPKQRHIFSEFFKFSTSLVYQYALKYPNGSHAWPSMGGFHILANHARYNRPEMEAVIPNAFYFTIIREPAAQLQSAFNYFDWAERYMPNKRMTDVFDTDPMMYANLSRAKRPLAMARNGQLFDLGLEQGEEFQDPGAVQDKIQALSQELDLVMITEYFDESLILLKKLLCWDFEDILYISQLVKNDYHANHTNHTLVDMIHKWNHADVQLYQHFNRTLWDKIQSYGRCFQDDLQTFRDLKVKTTNRCLSNSTFYLDSQKAKVYKLPPDADERCQDLVRLDTSWVPLIRNYISKTILAFMPKNKKATKT